MLENEAISIFLIFILVFSWKPLRNYFIWIIPGMIVFSALAAWASNSVSNPLISEFLGILSSTGFIVICLAVGALGMVTLAEIMAHTLGLIGKSKEPHTSSSKR